MVVDSQYVITLQITVRAKHATQADVAAMLLADLLKGSGEVEAKVVSVKGQHEGD